MKPAITLFIPDLLLPPLKQVDIYQQLELPALTTLLARGRKLPLAAVSAEAWLCNLFGLDGDNPPLAPLTLALDGGDAGNSYWLRADPVHLSVMRDQLMLVTSDAFSLSQQEAHELTDALNRHFADDGLLFYPLHPARWYLRFDNAPQLTTTPPEAVAGKHIDPYLPKGQDGLKWHAWYNEIQMLLFSHPTNQAREERGETAVNSIWVWGGGMAPVVTPPPFDRIYGNDLIARALAQASHTPTADLPASAATLMADRPGRPLVLLDQTRGAVQYNDLYGWREALEQLEHDWFAPLLTALRQHRLQSLRLVITGHAARELVITPLDLLKIWRRRKPLQHALT